MNPILLQMSNECLRLNYANFAQVGQCLTEVTLQGDPLLAGILLSIMFGGLIVRYNFPISLMLPFALALSYGLWLLSPTTNLFGGIYMFIIMIGGGILVIGLLKFINR